LLLLVVVEEAEVMETMVPVAVAQVDL